MKSAPGATVDRLTFLDLLRQSHILGEDQLASLADRFSEDEPTPSILSALVEEGQMTPYQARRLEQGDVQGLTLGQYRLLDEVGRGGFGKVFKAVHTIMGRVVALKLISPEFVEDSRARTWFKR